MSGMIGLPELDGESGLFAATSSRVDGMSEADFCSQSCF